MAAASSRAIDEVFCTSVHTSLAHLTHAIHAVYACLAQDEVIVLAYKLAHEHVFTDATLAPCASSIVNSLPHTRHVRSRARILLRYTCTLRLRAPLVAVHLHAAPANGRINKAEDRERDIHIRKNEFLAKLSFLLFLHAFDSLQHPRSRAAAQNSSAPLWSRASSGEGRLRKCLAWTTPRETLRSALRTCPIRTYP